MAHEYRATVKWTRGDAKFTDQRYSRGHSWSFDGGITVPALVLAAERAAALFGRRGGRSRGGVRGGAFELPHADVPLCGGEAGLRGRRLCGRGGRRDEQERGGRMWVSKVTLAPAITFAGEKRPTPQQLDELHHLAHDECYIANSVKSEVVVKGAMSFA